MSDKRIAAVLHLAGLKKSSESFSKEKIYWDTNFYGTKNILLLCNILNISKLIFSSSCSVYGNLGGELITEKSPTIPISPYGITKLAAEKLIDSFNENLLNFFSLRFFNVVGSSNAFFDESKSNLFPRIIEGFKRKKELNVYGENYNTKDGTCIRDYIHVDDIVDAHIAALNRLLNINRASSSCINLGSGKGFTVLDIIKEFEKQLNYKFQINYSKPRQGDPEVVIGANKKAKNVLNWTPKKTLFEMVSSHIKATVYGN